MATQSSHLLPGNGAEVNQAGRGRHATTGATSRRKYTRKHNKVILKCYYQSNPKNNGYRRRTWELWKTLVRFEKINNA